MVKKLGRICFFKGISVEVAHVKAHRTKKEKEEMTKIARFVTEGNEQCWTKDLWQK